MQTLNQNLLFEVQKDVCKALNDTVQLSAIQFLPENFKDIETLITTALKKQGICGIVMTPTMEFIGTYEGTDNVFELPDLTIQVVENVITNRAQNNTKYIGTAEDIAYAASDIMTSPSFGRYGKFSLVKIECGEESNLIVAKVIMKCVAHNLLSGTYDPPEYKTYHPFAYAGDLSALSVNVIENYATKAYVNDISSKISADLSGLIPTKTSQLINDSGFLTSHQSLTAYATKDDLIAKADLTALDQYQLTSLMTAYALTSDLTSKADLTALDQYQLTSLMTAYALTSDLTSKADLTSLANYQLTSEMTAYATKDELTSKADSVSVYMKNELSTFVLSGTYDDDTPFSFNVLYKI